MRNPTRSAVLGAIFAVSASLASAATVTIGTAPFTPGLAGKPDAATGTVKFNVMGSISNQRADPWAATAFSDKGAYVSVQKGSSATYLYAAGKRSIDLLWGTPDDYNFIDFYFAGKKIDSIGGGDTGIERFADRTTNRFVTVTTNSTFDRVTYRSNGNAFEFANVTLAPVPLPAAGLFLLGALGGLAALRRHRKD